MTVSRLVTPGGERCEVRIEVELAFKTFRFWRPQGAQVPRIPFTFSAVELLTMDGRVCPPPGMVYSTDPHRAEGEDGNSYFVKGPDVEVVFAELAGCTLAAAVGLPVPPVATCAYDGSLYAGSRKVDVREMGLLLKSTARILNATDLYNMIVVDVWLANPDRNMGSLVGTQLGHGKVEMMFIDFEKSVVLRPNPLIQTSLVGPRQVWPTGELGTILRQSKPLYPPVGILNAIERLTLARCEELLEPICKALPAAIWAEDSAFALSRRCEGIRTLTEEVWRCN